MMKKNYIIPLILSSKVFCQTSDQTFDNRPEFGFSHGTYANVCLQSPDMNFQKHLDGLSIPYRSPVCQTQFGFNFGLFAWKPLNTYLAIRPGLEAAFSNLCLRLLPKVRAKSLDVNCTFPLMIALKKPDPQGVIYLARNMSCYLTTKQPYMIIGSKFCFKRFDQEFKNKGYENERLVGALFGYGILYEFHGTKVAPEIVYSLELTKQNRISSRQKVTHSISVAINIF